MSCGSLVLAILRYYLPVSVCFSSRRRHTRCALVTGVQTCALPISSCAQHLLDLSIAPGDRIVLQLPNSWEFVALILACFRIGVIPVMALQIGSASCRERVCQYV